jgi:hypothetical protein
MFKGLSGNTLASVWEAVPDEGDLEGGGGGLGSFGFLPRRLPQSTSLFHFRGIPSRHIRASCGSPCAVHNSVEGEQILPPPSSRMS